ncbi:PhnA domain-containing protein [Spongiibacter sp. KMU-158]|uniref:PhnA domain-containing protein n=1 Tax=Spongiibacter pelagi TaxID=2760804 RepID=A0A927GW45_9GAMM|nr:alkylphosphonate utilization protein [Spongiibacter pelagi]MBD2858049.1 PhnA domain-containing protein [Spongiibacter pelagi]
MSLEQILNERSGNVCELCGSAESLSPLAVPPRLADNATDCVNACEVCRKQLAEGGELDVNHWHCLNQSMWSEVPAVQVMAFQILKRLSAEPWAQDLLDMLYLDDELTTWAKQGLESANAEKTLDSNGAVLQAGDTVTLIKDLDVKGANFTAKRGTAVRGISLTSNPEHIEGRVNGQRIVIISKFVKRSN